MNNFLLLMPYGHRHVYALLFALLTTAIQADELSFDQALQRARQQAPQLQQRQATLAGVTASHVTADALPDPKAFIGVDNLPVEGAERFSLTRDFMTMQKIGIIQDIPNANKRRARAEAAQARIDSATADLRLTQTTVDSEVAAAWLNRFFLGRQLALFAELEKENQLLSGLAQAQLASGKGLAADALLPVQEALALASRRDDLERDIRKANAILERWLGGTDEFTPAGNPPTFAVDAHTLRDHLQHHPALNLYQPRTALAQAELHEAQAARQPDWGVELAWQQRGPAYSNMISFQVSADLPLFTRTRQNPMIVARQQAIASLDAEREDMLREHEAMLEADLADYDALSRQLTRLQQEALPLAQRKVDVQLASYQAGRTDLGLVLVARREWRELRLQAISLTAQQQMLAASLHYRFALHEEPTP